MIRQGLQKSPKAQVRPLVAAPQLCGWNRPRPLPDPAGVGRRWTLSLSHGSASCWMRWAPRTEFTRGRGTWEQMRRQTDAAEPDSLRNQRELASLALSPCSACGEAPGNSDQYD